MAIYGNALMTGAGQGGGGGEILPTDAILRVIAPAGSTVTITKGATSKTDMGHENADDPTLYDYYFIIHQSQFDSVNPWTVTATLGSNTASDTVIIDTADEYDLIMSYHVPSEYQEVEYLESSGTQHLMTSVKPNVVASGEFGYMILTQVNYACVFGSCNSQFNSGCLALAQSAVGAHGLGYASSYVAFDANTLNTKYEGSFSVSSGTQSATVNGNTYSDTISGSPNSSYNIALFGCNYAGTVKTAERMKGRIYYLRLYDTNGDILFEGYPCYRKSDSVAGVWDKVSETFLTNQGSGSFVVGGDVN